MTVVMEGPTHPALRQGPCPYFGFARMGAIGYLPVPGHGNESGSQ